LDSVRHLIETSIGIYTLYKSQGKIPDRFLRDVGVPEEIIDIARSLRAGPPIQWHSCLISYSTKDDEFARRLYTRMREANIRVWFAPEELKGGKKLHEQLFEAIQIHDRLLIVLSEHSIQSEWVICRGGNRREFARSPGQHPAIAGSPRFVVLQFLDGVVQRRRLVRSPAFARQCAVAPDRAGASKPPLTLPACLTISGQNECDRKAILLHPHTVNRRAAQ
jgi:hypothetical protein